MVNTGNTRYAGTMICHLKFFQASSQQRMVAVAFRRMREGRTQILNLGREMHLTVGCLPKVICRSHFISKFRSLGPTLQRFGTILDHGDSGSYTTNRPRIASCDASLGLGAGYFQLLRNASS